MRGLAASLSTHHFTFREYKMKNLRTVGAACVLALALAAPAFAGHIQTPVVPPEPTAAGQIDVPPADPVTEAALSLLESLLALF